VQGSGVAPRRAAGASRDSLRCAPVTRSRGGIGKTKALRLDEVDRQLISLLRNDARMPVASLAKALRVSRGTVQNRMARLEADGTIASYTIRLKPAVEEHRIRALMTVAVEGNRVDAVIKALRGDPAVTTLHSTNGRWDIVVELRADSLEAFDRVLARIRLIEGISQSETSLLLSTFK
jgi:DNA-binding Lrp family transcriptional regulator